MTIFEALVISRWLHFAAVFVLFGSPLFWMYADREASPRSYAASLVFLRGAALLAVVSGFAWLAGILANMTGGFGNIADLDVWYAFFFETQFGTPALLRLMLLLALLLCAFVRKSRSFSLRAFLIVSFLLLINQAWLGHAAEGGTSLIGLWMLLCYDVHMLSAAAWVGGLPLLLSTLLELRQSAANGARERALLVLSRFSVMAMPAVAAIILSGIANAGFRVAGSFDKLFWTAYGGVLVMKLSLVSLMLALAYFNHFIAMPRLARATSAGSRQMSYLRFSIACELALAILVLGVAAVLGITPPPQ